MRDTESEASASASTGFAEEPVPGFVAPEVVCEEDSASCFLSLLVVIWVMTVWSCFTSWIDVSTRALRASSSFSLVDSDEEAILFGVAQTIKNKS